MDLEDITSTDVQRIFNNMGDSAKQESKNKVKTVLNQIFKIALDDNLIGPYYIGKSIAGIYGTYGGIQTDEGGLGAAIVTGVNAGNAAATDLN